jgi:hypothetical protein
MYNFICTVVYYKRRRQYNPSHQNLFGRGQINNHKLGMEVTTSNPRYVVVGLGRRNTVEGSHGQLRENLSKKKQSNAEIGLWYG